MAIYIAQTTLKMLSGIPADAVTNTMHFDLEVDQFAIGDVIDLAQGQLETFYEDALGDYRSPLMSQSGHETSWYDITQPTPRVPTSTETWAFPTAVSNSLALPNEVCSVASFQAVKLSGVSQSRRRNRIYLGPLNGSAIVSSSGMIATAFMNDATTAMQNLASFSATPGTNSFEWVGWSPTDLTSFELQNGWMDNAPDIQRRRGLEATQRVVWPGP